MKPLIMIVITIQDREIGRATHLEMVRGLLIIVRAYHAHIQCRVQLSAWHHLLQWPVYNSIIMI